MLTSKQILKRLKKAKNVCHECGKANGNCIRISDEWKDGKCDVCILRSTVTSVRYYGYLLAGIKRYEKIINSEKKSLIKLKKAQSPTKKKKTLDDVFSKYIRLRDCDENGYCACCTCGKVLFWKEITNGHWISRGVMSTRWSEYNCHPQCWGCQAKHLGNGKAHIHETFIIDQHGENIRDALLESAKSLYVETPYDRLIEYFTNEVNTLREQKRL